MMNRDRLLGKRILLAEDQTDVRHILTLLLQTDKHIVACAANGREALDRFTLEPFDLVITDYVMPEMNGDELALRIKQLAPAQPILLITASSDALDRCAGCVDAILRKPFSLEELRADIARLIGAAAAPPPEEACPA